MKKLDLIRQRQGFIRAGIYMRFSSEMQREESIDAQRRAINDYAKNNDVIIVSEYVDKAKSGMSSKRPKFLKMIEDSKEDIFDIVLIHKLDRFARNRKDSITYRMVLKKNNIELVSVLENLDGSPESIILESVLEGMAEYFSVNLAREIQKGKIESAMKCKHMGGTPALGYSVDPLTKKYKINDKEAHIIELIFKMYSEGQTYNEIINVLNISGFKTKRGNKFGKNSIHDILTNERYTGVYIYNQIREKNLDGKRNSHCYKSDKEQIRIENGIPAIISKQLWANVQYERNRRNNNVGNLTHRKKYLLNGKIECGICGGIYTGTSAGKGRQLRYVCNKKNGKEKCCNTPINKNRLEMLVLEKLSNYIFDNEFKDAIISEYQTYQKEVNEELESDIKRIERQLFQSRNEVRNIVNVIASTGSDELVKELDKFKIRKAELEHRLNEFRKKKQKATIKVIEEGYSQVKSSMINGKICNEKGLINQSVEKLIIYPNLIEIQFKNIKADKIIL
jgi:site-specific DNA recombinase